MWETFTKSRQKIKGVLQMANMQTKNLFQGENESEELTKKIAEQFYSEIVTKTGRELKMFKHNTTHSLGNIIFTKSMIRESD